jgi:hypothetical protein
VVEVKSTTTDGLTKVGPSVPDTIQEESEGVKDEKQKARKKRREWVQLCPTSLPPYPPLSERAFICTKNIFSFCGGVPKRALKENPANPAASPVGERPHDTRTVQDIPEWSSEIVPLPAQLVQKEAREAVLLISKKEETDECVVVPHEVMVLRRLL